MARTKGVTTKLESYKRSQESQPIQKIPISKNAIAKSQSKASISPLILSASSSRAPVAARKSPALPVSAKKTTLPPFIPAAVPLKVPPLRPSHPVARKSSGGQRFWDSSSSSAGKQANRREGISSSDESESNRTLDSRSSRTADLTVGQTASKIVDKTVNKTLNETASETTEMQKISLIMANVEQLDEDMLDFKQACQNENFNKNKELWESVLSEVTEFRDSIDCQIKLIDGRVKKLAKFYLKFEESIDKQEVKRMIEEKRNLSLAEDALKATIKTIQKMDYNREFGSLRLSNEFCPVVSNLISAIFEHKRKIQEIAENSNLRALYKELIDDKVSAYKGVDEKQLDVTLLNEEKEASRLVVLELKRRIHSSYKEKSQDGSP